MTATADPAHCLGPDRLREAGGLAFLAAASVIPFNLLLNDVAGRDLHVTMLTLGAIAAIAAARLVRGETRFGSPAVLDWLVAAFLAWSVFHLAFLGAREARALKGFLVETRFAWIYLAARALDLDARFVRRLLKLYLVLVIGAGIWGLAEYYLFWGSALEIGDRLGDPKYWKKGIARLYSPVITPAQTAYFLFGGICAAAGRWMEGERRLPAVAVLLAMIALPLTLTRTAFAWTILALPALAIGRRSLRSFFLVAVLCGLVSIVVFRATGVSKQISRYASGGFALGDASAQAHETAVASGVEDFRMNPLGYGFGEAGSVAQAWGGRTHWNETYFLTLGSQAGAPAVLMVAGVFLAAAFHCARAAWNSDAAIAQGGVFALAFLSGVVLGSLFLPVGSTAWVQILLFPAVAAAVNEERRASS